MSFPGSYPGGHLELHVVSEGTATLTLGWDTPSSAGYRFDSEHGRRSHTWDTTRRTVRFAKGSSWYRVDALDVSATGEHRPQAMPASYGGTGAASYAASATATYAATNVFSFAGSTAASYSGTALTSYAAGTAQYPSTHTYPGLGAYPGVWSFSRTPSFGGTGAASYASAGIATYD